ncbi:hypothetical protein EV426DRAFT_704967 [Tirmania nivea]|nr:hypothetical protein EV426DRAFT_704967 [Tirmania nivea]
MAQTTGSSPGQSTSPSFPTRPRPVGPPLHLNSHRETLSRRILHELAMIALIRAMERLQLHDVPVHCRHIQERSTNTSTALIPNTPAGPESSTVSTAEPTTVSGILCKPSPNGTRIVPPSRRPNGTIRPARRIRPGYIPPEDVGLYSVRNIPGIKNLLDLSDSQKSGEARRPKEGQQIRPRRRVNQVE